MTQGSLEADGYGDIRESGPGYLIWHQWHLCWPGHCLTSRSLLPGSRQQPTQRTYRYKGEPTKSGNFLQCKLICHCDGDDDVVSGPKLWWHSLSGAPRATLSVSVSVARWERRESGARHTWLMTHDTSHMTLASHLNGTVYSGWFRRRGHSDRL